MESAGKNRYELLFMDDDVSDPLDNLPTKKKQQQVKPTTAGAPQKSTTASTTKTQKPSKKQPSQAEKENKPSMMNKNEANKRGVVTAGTDGLTTKQQQGVVGNFNRKRNVAPGGGGEIPSQGRNANFRPQSDETREVRNNRRNTRENSFNNAGGAVVENGGQQNRQFRDRGDNRGPARQRNFEGGNNYNREFRGKREFDRQSGSDRTGVKAVDKRDGAGAHNWGSIKEAIDDVNNKTADSNTEGGANNIEKSEESGNDQVEQTPMEEEAKELTLDEWKAQKQQRVKPQFNIRKAGEGEDTSQWKKMIALNNTKKKGNESEEELEYDPAMYPQRVGRQQRVLDIQFNFNDGRRGGFGGRGRGRGGQRSDGSRAGFGAGERGGRNDPAGDRSSASAIGQRGGFDGARTGRGGLGASKSRSFAGDKQQHAPKVNDERQFPTLA